MKKKILAVAIASMVSSANAASLDDLRISGFGSVGIGKSDTAIDYAGYTEDKLDWEQETLVGLQFDFQINERAKFVSQIVSNSSNDYELEMEMGYASYSFDAFTVRAGKLRAPIFLYSDYVDLGYAYPMIRPSEEMYGSLPVKGYTGVDFLIPIEFENSSLLLQPVAGTGHVKIDDYEITLDELFGLSASWNYEDITLRGSYFMTELKTSDSQIIIFNEVETSFVTLGMQYDNGDFLANIEAADVKLEGLASDYHSVIGVVGYRFSEVTPYLSMGWTETTDNDERDGTGYEALSYERTSYSMGARWDFASNMALTADLTYADFNDTNGGYFYTNVGTTGQPIEDSLMVYSVKLDVIF